MMNSRIRCAIMLVGLGTLSWLAMMLVHETGHVLGAALTGGRVRQVVWHPLVFSRTEVSPNPRPGVVVWAGPIVGVFVPLVVWIIVRLTAKPFAYLAAFFAGFCLLANGAYLGLGWIDAVGDTAEMRATGTPVWIMIAFGGVAAAAGLWLWHPASRQLGFGKDASAPPTTHTIAVGVIALVSIALGVLCGNTGTRP